MTVLATDAFTRANAANLGANWTAAKGSGGTQGILTNQACTESAGGRDGAYYSAVTAPNDQYSQSLAVALMAQAQGVLVRSITSGTTRNHYAAGQNANGFGGVNTTSRVWKEVANVLTSLGTGATTLAGGQTLYIEVQGTAIKMFINGVQEISVSDGALTSGQFGIWSEHSSANVAVWDDFEGGDFSVAATAAGPAIMGSMIMVNP